MAFSSTLVGRPQAQFTGKLVSWGTWDADGTTSGNIDTGLKICEFIALQPKGSTGNLTHINVDETLPCAGSAVTINMGTSLDVDGYWWAFGY